MRQRYLSLTLIFTGCLWFGIASAAAVWAEDKEIKPEEFVAKHLQSIAKSEVLQAVKSRAFTGTATVQFIIGANGQMAGQSQLVSEGHKLGLLLNFGAQQYPKESFAFDGKDVTVAYIDHGERSPIGSFVSLYGDLLKEGLIGGTLSTAWPLLEFQSRGPKLKIKMKKVDGRDLYEVNYKPKRAMGNLVINLYFDPETFRHLGTEYKIRITPVSVMATGDTSDSIYLLKEQFDDFKEVEGIMLPHNYRIHYSIEGRTGSFLANWTVKASQWHHNVTIDQKLFNAEK